MRSTRLFSLILALSLLFSLCACAGGQNGAQTETTGKAEPSGRTQEQTTPGAQTEEPTDKSQPVEVSTAAPETEENTPSAPTPTQEDTSAPEDTTTPEPELSEEEKADRAFLAGIAYPTYSTGEEGSAYFFGRWYDKEIDGVAHKVTVTDGAQIFFLVQNTSRVYLDFTVITKHETPFIAVSVDGGEPQRQRITEQTIDLPDTGRHVLRIFADGMVESEGRWAYEIGFALREIRVEDGGRLRGIVPQNKVVFFYGDSITEGIMALGGENTSHNNSATSAYPYFCSKKLGVIPYYVGYSGSGVTVNGSFSIFMNAIDHLSRTRDADLSVIPDLIVINHGTNDYGASSDDFTKLLKRALNSLVKYYPDVPIIYMIPFYGSHADDIIALAAKYKNVTVVKTDGWNIPYTDGLHPNKAGANKAGELLASSIEKIVGKEFFEF